MSEYTHVLVRSEGDHNPPVDMTVGERFPYSYQLIEEYANTVTREARDLSHPIRVCALLSDFSHARLNDETLEAVLLHDIAQTAVPESNGNPHSTAHLYEKNAQRLLKQYANTSYAQQVLPGTNMTRWQYEAGILADLNLVESYAESNRAIPVGKSKELQGLLTSHSIGGVKQEFWLEPGALTMPANMAELLRDGKDGMNANLEAVLIKSAEKLDHLLFPGDNDRTLLRNIHDAESFYAPLCEIIGADGLASALRSQAAVIRLQRSGHGAFVDKATDIVTALGDRQEVLGTVEGLLGKLAVGDVEVDHAFRDTTGHGINLGTAELEAHDADAAIDYPKEARAIWRIKSVGSLALKLLSDHQHLIGKSEAEQRSALAHIESVPADVLGITILAPNEDALATLYARSAAIVHDDNDVHPTSSPSRHESYHVSGTMSFKRKILGALALEATNQLEDGTQKVDRGDIDIPQEERIYPVAKFTVEYTGLRTEVQFQTEEARVEARVGLAAHILYKLKKQLAADATSNGEQTMLELTTSEVDAMKEIHDRAVGLGAYNLVNGQEKRYQDFMKYIRSVSSAPRIFSKRQR